MPNPVYTYILDIYDLEIDFEDNILKQAGAHLFAHS